MVSPRCRELWLPRRGAAQGTALPQRVHSKVQCGHEALWPCHLQGKTSPTDSESPCTMGRVVVLFLSFPATRSRLHSCSLTQGLQILPTPAQPPGRARPLLLAEQVGRTRSVKVRKVFGIREKGNEECGYHHGRLGAPCFCGRRPLQ